MHCVRILWLLRPLKRLDQVWEKLGVEQSFQKRLRARVRVVDITKHVAVGELCQSKLGQTETSQCVRAKALFMTPPP